MVDINSDGLWISMSVNPGDYKLDQRRNGALRK